MEAINCKTPDEFRQALEIFEKKGWKSMSGDKPTIIQTAWHEYGQFTYITYGDGCGYGSVKSEEAERFQIISFEEFLKLEGRAKSFPRMMLVSDDEDDPLSDWEELEVLGYAEGVDFPWIVSNDIGKEWEYFGYKYAIDVAEEVREAINLLERKGYKVTKNN